MNTRRGENAAGEESNKFLSFTTRVFAVTTTTTGWRWDGRNVVNDGRPRHVSKNRRDLKLFVPPDENVGIYIRTNCARTEIVTGSR